MIYLHRADLFTRSQAKSATLLWIRKMVIGMNLCPFAFDAMAVKPETPDPKPKPQTQNTSFTLHQM